MIYKKLIDPLAQLNLFDVKNNRYSRIPTTFLSSYTAICIITVVVLAATYLSNITNLLQIINFSQLPIKTQNLSIFASNKPPHPRISGAINARVADNNTVIELKQTLIKQLNWQTVKVKRGDNLSLIFYRVGLTSIDVYKIAKLGKAIEPLLKLKPEQSILFCFATSISNNNILKLLSLQLTPTTTLVINATITGYKANITIQKVEAKRSYAYGQITSSLFKAGTQANLSDKLIMEFAHIFSWDIDFALDLRVGDQFKVVYEENYIGGNKIEDGNILAAEFTNNGKIFQAVRYNINHGLSQFYESNGDSLNKEFRRSPVQFARISSKFSPNRKHPVLKVSRPHLGVDYVASRGTPILATGDGKVNFIGIKGGYGRTIILTHGDKYTTLYAHMSRYRKDIKPGERVKQGDIIGYIGSSGLATGPHLHYEFRVNGIHHNPLTINLPKGKALDKKFFAAFKSRMQNLVDGLNTLDNTTLNLH